MIIAPLITFYGACQKALDFYQRVFPIDSINVTKFKDSPSASMFTITPENENYVYHAALRFKCGTTVAMGDSITLMMSPSDIPSVKQGEMFDVFGLTADEIRFVYNEFIAISSAVSFPLGPKDGCELFASIIDPFGVVWNFQCDAANMLSD